VLFKEQSEEKQSKADIARRGIDYSKMFSKVRLDKKRRLVYFYSKIVAGLGRETAVSEIN